MSDTAINEYQDKLEELTRACSDIKSIMGTVTKWSNCFQKWNDFIISDRDSFDASLTANGKTILSTKDFPSPEQIHKAFAHYYQTKGDARRAYDSLSAAQRTGLQAPGECT